MKNLICFSLFLIGCASCNDTIKDAPGVEVTFKNPALLYFENEEELQNTLEGISELSEEKLINWEESKNFFSYRRLISNVFEEMLQEQNPEKLEKLIIENKEYVKTYYDNNGERVVDNAISSVYESIINENRLYQVGSNIYKVVNDSTIAYTT